MNIKKINSVGTSHLLILLLVIVACAVGGTYMLVSSRAEQATTASHKRKYYYQKPTKAQLNKLKRIAGHYWGGICNNGKNIRVAYYWGPMRLPDITDPEDTSSTDFSVDLDAAAYVMQQPSRNPRSAEYCTIHVNEASISGTMNRGMPFSTKRYM